MIAILSGLVAGLIHVFSGADHLAAVAPLSLEQRLRAWTIGLRWGLGHASGVLVVGGLAVLLREALPIHLLSSWSERLVGIVLIAIGLWGLRKALTLHLHAHPHPHADHQHVHIHVHGRQSAHPHTLLKSHRHTHAAFAIGTLHGLAGSSHVFGILPALAFPTRVQAVSYMVAYGVGTIGAMTSFSSLLGLVANGSGAPGDRLYRLVMLGCSGMALVIGGYWLIG